MPRTSIDLITENPKTDEFALILVEDGPWPTSDTAWPEYLRRIQGRIYDAIDVAVDGHLAAKYPDSRGKPVRVEVNCPSGVPPALATLVGEIRAYIAADGEYSKAIAKSPFIQGLIIATRQEASPLPKPT